MVAILEAVDLRKTYRKFRADDVVALRGLNLSIGSPGAVHGFLGPNGSGKTTAIRCLLGLIRPTGGDVRLFGVDSTTGLHQVVDRVGAIVENPKMFPNFSGRRNLSLLAKAKGLPSRSVDRVLETVGLADRGDDSFAGYSLGMKQRLAIAAALLKDPELLILDEPANGLDPAGIAEIRALIRTLSAEGKTVLVSSHQLSEIEQVCTEATIIANGAVVESGSLDDIRAKHGTPAVIVTIDDVSVAARTLTEAGLTVSQRGNHRELSVEIPVHQAAEVNRLLADRGLYLSGLRSDAVTLESAFFTLTSGQPAVAPPPPPPTAQPSSAAAATGSPPAPVTPPPPASAPAPPEVPS